jgi:tetratricopeptide (TPR) repeat protein
MVGAVVVQSPRDSVPVSEDDARELARLAASYRERSLTNSVEEVHDRLTERVDELGTALVAVTAQDHDAGLRAAGGLSIFWQDTGLVDVGRRVTAEVLATAGDATTVAYAEAALVAGELAFRQGDQAEATAWTLRARDVAVDRGEAVLAARAEVNLARIAFRDGDAATIEDHAQAALARAGDDPRVRVGATHMLGWAAYTAGDVTAATRIFAGNADHYRDLGDALGEASELGNVADLCMETGELATAAEHLARALECPAARSSLYLAPALVRSAGTLAGLRGLHDESVELLEGADELYRRSGLVGDPGDELTPRVRADVEAALGEARVQAAREHAATRTLDELTALAALAARSLDR